MAISKSYFGPIYSLVLSVNLTVAKLVNWQLSSDLYGTSRRVISEPNKPSVVSPLASHQLLPIDDYRLTALNSLNTKSVLHTLPASLRTKPFGSQCELRRN